MLNTKFLHKTGREDTRCERSSENGTELRVKTTNAHGLELEIRSYDRIRGGPSTRGLEIQRGLWVLEEINLRMSSEDASGSSV